MEQESTFVALGVALGVGALIGFEREQSAGGDGRAGETSSMGGIRTYPVVALAGALSTILSREIGHWIVVAAFAAVAGFIAISYADDVRNGRDRGLTSEAAMLVVFLLGALAPSEHLAGTPNEKVVLLFSVAVVVTLLLSLKPALHGIARKATKDDVYATLKFLLVAVVLLPFLPDRAFDPYDVLNPYRIGLLIALIAGVGFAGYVAVRALGPGRGLGITGLVGGLVSSTAVTLASAGHAKREPALRASCAMAVVLANTVMGPRVLVVVAAVNPDFAQVLAVPIAAVTLVGLVASWYFWRRAQGASTAAGELEIKNPFELTSAIKMGALIAAVLFVSKAAAVNLGTGAVYVTSVFAGVTDVDAISVSMAHLAGPQVAPHVAATAVLLAIAANTVTKAGIATVIGGWPFGRTLFATSAAILLAALAGIAMVWA